MAAYRASVCSLSLVGFTPYVLGHISMEKLFESYPKLQVVSGYFGTARCHARPETGPAQVRYTLDIDLFDPSSLAQTYLWRNSPRLPDMIHRSGLKTTDSVSYRISCSPSDWLFSPESMDEIESFITRTPSIERLTFMNENTAQLVHRITFLKTLKIEHRPQTIRLERFRLSVNQETSETESLATSLEELWKLCETIELDLKESITPAHSRGLTGKQAYELAAHENARTLQCLNRIVLPVLHIVPTVTFAFRILMSLPRRRILLEWAQHQSGDSNGVDEVSVRIRPSVTKRYDHGEPVFHAEYYTYEFDAACIVDLLAKMFAGKRVLYRLDLVTDPQEEGSGIALEPYTSRARKAVVRYLAKHPELDMREQLESW